MKSLMHIFSIAIITTLIFSCKKFIAAVFPGEDVQLQQMKITIPSIPFADSTKEIKAGTFNIYINADSIIRANTKGMFGINSISSVKVKQVTIKCSNADAVNNVAVLSSLHIDISSHLESSISILSINIPPWVTNTFSATPTGSPEIVEYLHNTYITQTVYVRVRKTTTKPLNLFISVTLTAK